VVYPVITGTVRGTPNHARTRYLAPPSVAPAYGTPTAPCARVPLLPARERIVADRPARCAAAVFAAFKADGLNGSGIVGGGIGAGGGGMEGVLNNADMSDPHQQGDASGQAYQRREDAEHGLGGRVAFAGKLGDVAEIDNARGGDGEITSDRRLCHDRGDEH